MNPEYKFGKKILNTLTTGMYSNAMFIYREYIQNAADSIDDAVDSGLLSEEGFQIHVEIDPRARSISIEDNAMGIPQKRVTATLGNIADSSKDRKTKKGFIGIGRLGGLGYCRKVIFETSYFGEDTKSISEWDAEKIREIMHDSAITDNASTVLRKTVNFRSEACEKKFHFFKVTLCDITESNDDLLNADKVYRYLQMVAPVEFNFSEFPHKKIIRDFISKNSLPQLNEYQIFLNKQKITKGYVSRLKIPGQKEGVEIKSIQPGLLREDGEVIGWYWYGITEFSGTMEKCWQSGMRLRKANIQIGEEDCLYQHNLWKERRGNFYFFGEVHALDPDLIPNGRRDYFEEDVHCRRLERALRDLFNKMLGIVYAASNVRSAAKNVEKKRTEITRLKDKVRDGNFDDEESRTEAVKQINDLKGKLNEAVQGLNKVRDKWKGKKDDDVVGAAVTSIVENVNVDTRPVKSVGNAVATRPVPLATDGLSSSQKKVLDVVRKVLMSKLPPEEFEVIWDDVLKKIKTI